jgi:hypothetical protein
MGADLATTNTDIFSNQYKHDLFVDILIDLLNAILCVWNCDSKESIVTENK